MNAQVQRERERLRDKFAAAALTGLLAKANGSLHCNVLVHDAYGLADIMLAHRDANPLPLGESPKAPQ